MRYRASGIITSVPPYYAIVDVYPYVPYMESFQNYRPILDAWFIRGRSRIAALNPKP